MAASISKNNSLLKVCEEVIIATTYGAEDQNWNVSAWDVRTGNLLQKFHNGSAKCNSLCILGGECLLAASHTKPVIHVWNMLRQSQKHRKLICGSKVSCLATTPDNCYIAAGMEDKIHIWQVRTGELYNILSYTSVEVKCLRFSPCGDYLISGYRDGTVAVWELQDILYLDPVHYTENSPLSIFQGHSGEVTDLHIGLSNTVASSAMDFTVRIWSLLNGEELKMFELGAPVSCVTMDHSELALYAGDVNGKVFCIDLHFEPAARSVHIDSREKKLGFTFHSAHTASVTCMCLSRDQSKLITASNDKTVKVWSMMSAVTPLTINLNDRVSNLLVVATPSAIAFPDRKPQISIGNLKRHLHNTEEEDNSGDLVMDIPACEVVPRLFESRSYEAEKATLGDRNDTRFEPEASSKKVESLKQRANRLKKANEEIYQFALKEIVK